MKFKIRFADQIVGFFIVLSLVSLVFVIVMLGRAQRWFAKDVSFSTILPSAGGLSKNMAVQYRGFTIGNVKTFYLTDNDDVEVIFTIYEEYGDRVRQGSTVEMMISPVGLGNQFLLHTGRGEILAAGAFVPVVGSAQAKELVRQGLAIEPRHDDSISLLMNRVSSVLGQLDEALGPGTDETEIGVIVSSVRETLVGAKTLPDTIDQTLGDALGIVEGLQSDLKPILSNLDDILTDIHSITTELNDPDGLLYTVLDTDKDVYVNLVKSLEALAGILESLEKTANFIPGQLPQIAGLITDVRVALKTAEDVLVALTNNPLLRRGVPQRPDSQSGGTSPRDIRF